MSNVLELTDENFDKETKDKLVLIDFFATWCGPCKMMAPVYDEIANEVEGVSYFKVDTDNSPNLTKKFGIMTVPTFLVMKNNKEESRLIGVVTKEELISELKKFL